MCILKDILIVILLLVLVTMTCLHEGDILDLKRGVFLAEDGLQSLHGGLIQLKGGLDRLTGGSGLKHFRSCSATLWVTRNPKSPTWGTGVFVSDNVLLTAKHVVEDRINDESVSIIGPDGVTYTAVEILEDADDDLAVVIIRGRSGPWMDMGPWPSLGDIVICIGTPFQEQAQLIITWGRVSSEKWKNKFVYDGFAWSGCSGGPIIVDGKLAGIVKARLRRTASLGFGTPINRLDPDLMARIQ